MWLLLVKRDGVSRARSLVLGVSGRATLIEPPWSDPRPWDLAPPQPAATAPVIAMTIAIHARRHVALIQAGPRSPPARGPTSTGTRRRGCRRAARADPSRRRPKSG